MNISAVLAPVRSAAAVKALPVMPALQTGAAAKDASVETLRGLAITLMVAAHVIGTNAETGLAVASDSAYRYFYYCSQYLRMPLFVVISGYLYAGRPVAGDKVGSFFRGKLRRLMLPFAVAASLQYVVRAYTPGVNRETSLADMWQIYLWPFDQFWFIQALLGIFVVVALLDCLRLMEKPATLGAVLILAAAYALHPLWLTGFFAMNGMVMLLPFFLFGCAMRRFPEVFQGSWAMVIYAVGFVAAFSLQQYAWFGEATLPMEIVGMAVGLCGIGLLFRVRRPLPALAWLGSFAFAIYLYHVFGTAGTRMLLTRMGIDAKPLLLATGLVAGLALPIALELLVRRWAPLRRVVLGMR